MGNNSSAVSNNSIAIGDYVSANTQYGFNIGRRNEGLTNTIFELGYGTSVSDKKNAMTVTTLGNVGIKKSDPQYTLDVSGSIQSNTAFYMTGGTIPWKITLSGDNLSFQAFTGGSRVERSAMTP
jgi:hypothetical protein